jgi:dihydropteroate synthase
VNRTIPFGTKTLVMGIINVTPDSFYAESRTSNTERAIERALKFEELGADIVDVGGESTRPGSLGVDIDEEVRRVIPVVEGIRRRSSIYISVDTYKPQVAALALDLGVEMINDVTGLGTAALHTPKRTYAETPPYESAPPVFGELMEWNELGSLIAKRGAHVILMHMRGIPSNMQSMTGYEDVVREVSAELDRAVGRALGAGIGRDRIVLDPGIGFAKTAEQNLLLIRSLHLLKKKGYPICVGLSRKSFLGSYTDKQPEARLAATIAANAISIFKGADILRVHDVGEAVDTARIVNAIVGGVPGVPEQRE